MNVTACEDLVVSDQYFLQDAVMLVAMPNKASLVAVIDPDKGSVFDIKTKRLVRTVPKWGGMCTKDGKTGLYAPSRWVLFYSRRFDIIALRLT